MSGSCRIPVYATKADFNACGGLAPYLQPASATIAADSCCICLKDLAHEASDTTPHQPLSEAEKAFLDTVLEDPDDIIIFIPEEVKRDRVYPLPHHQIEEQVGARLTACGHVFGKDCIETWLEQRNSCPMCRKMFFPSEEPDEEYEELEYEEEEYEELGEREDLRAFFGDF
jgi:hypothetical protein